MITQLRLKQLYFLLESAAIKGIPISKSNHYQEILTITRQILEAFGISRIKKHESMLIQYVYNAEFTDHFMDDVLIYLTKMAEKGLTGDIYDFLPSKTDEPQDETDNLTDELDEEFERLAELEWQEMEAEREKRLNALQNLPRTIEHEAVKHYLSTHLDFPISDNELADIETGFMLYWKYANVQHSGDLSFQWAVDNYLNAIESPMDRKRMAQIVDSMLEYLQEIRLWGYPQ